MTPPNPSRALTNHIWPISPNIWPKSDYFSKQYLTKIWPKSGLFDHPEVNIIVLFFMRAFTGSFNNMNRIPWFNWLPTGRKKSACLTNTSNMCIDARRCYVLAGLKLLNIIRYWNKNSEKAIFSAKFLTKIWPKKSLAKAKDPRQPGARGKKSL